MNTNTIDRSFSLSSFGRLAGTLLGVVALSGQMLACAVPTESQESAPSEATGTAKAALDNDPNGGSGSGGSCINSWLSCNDKCEALYDGIDQQKFQDCGDLCDDILRHCDEWPTNGGIVAASPTGGTTGGTTGGKIGPIKGGTLSGVTSVSVAH